MPPYLASVKRFVSSVIVLSLAGCAPSYVWGKPESVKQRLVVMVPLDSPLIQLAATAKQRGWEIDRRNIRSWPAGTETYMDDCRSRGGPVVPVVVAHYHAPFETHVESLWLFDPQKRLRDICVRKTIDAL